MKKRVLALLLGAIVAYSAIVPFTVEVGGAAPCSMLLWATGRQSFGEESPTYTVAGSVSEFNEEIRRAIHRYSPSGRYLLPLAPPGMNTRTELEFIDIFAASYFMSGRVPMFMPAAQTVGHYYYHMFHNSPGLGSNHLVAGETLTVVRHPGATATEVAAQHIPEELRTFRFDTYVGRGSPTSSNTRGAFGLMYEFGAYLYDFTLTMDLADYILTFIEKNDFSSSFDGVTLSVVRGYLNSVSNTVQAFYEFAFWTLEYLLYLRQNSRVEFELYLRNAEFRRTFAYFWNTGMNLVNNIEPVRTQLIFDALAPHGIVGEADGSGFTLRSDEGWVTVGNRNLSEAQLLREQIETPRLSEMLAEMLRGYGNLGAGGGSFEICGDCGHCTFGAAFPDPPPIIVVTLPSVERLTYSGTCTCCGVTATWQYTTTHDVLRIVRSKRNIDGVLLPSCADFCVNSHQRHIR
jgi:hypothetical protein